MEELDLWQSVRYVLGPGERIKCTESGLILIEEREEETVMLFKYMRESCHFCMVMIISISRWYVVDTFFSPNNVRVEACVPEYVMNPILLRSLDAIRICKYPELASRC